MRHPETVANTRRFLSGREDVELTERGERERLEAIEAVCANPDYVAELGETMQTVPGDMTHDEAVTYLKGIEATYVDLLSNLK